MASLTHTFSQFSDNLKAVHTGMICAGGALSRTTTICPSSVLNMVQVPHGATLLDFYLKIVQGGADQHVEIGTSNTPSGIMQLTTLTRTHSFSASISLDVLTLTVHGDNDRLYIRAPGGARGGTSDLMPVRISLSDDVQPASIWLQGRVAVGVSASAFFNFVLFYTMDGLTGHTTIR